MFIAKHGMIRISISLAYRAYAGIEFCTRRKFGCYFESEKDKSLYSRSVPTARDSKKEGGRWHEGKRGSGLLELCEH